MVAFWPAASRATPKRILAPSDPTAPEMRLYASDMSAHPELGLCVRSRRTGSAPVCAGLTMEEPRGAGVGASGRGWQRRQHERG